MSGTKVCSSWLVGKYPFKALRKTYFTSFCLLKCLWNIVTWLMYRTAPLTETVSWRSFVELQTRHEPCEVRVRWPPSIFVLSWSSGHRHFCLHFPPVMQFYIVLYCILYWHENGRNGSQCLIGLISPKSSLDLQLASSLVTFLFDW